MKKRDVEEVVVEEILKECSLNFVERIVARIFYREFLKFYHIARINLINSLRPD